MTGMNQGSYSTVYYGGSLYRLRDHCTLHVVDTDWFWPLVQWSLLMAGKHWQLSSVISLSSCLDLMCLLKVCFSVNLCGQKMHDFPVLWTGSMCLFSKLLDAKFSWQGLQENVIFLGTALSGFFRFRLNVEVKFFGLRLCLNVSRLFLSQPNSTSTGVGAWL